MGVIIFAAALGIVTFVFLFILAILIIKARPNNPENRFMSVLILAEGFRVLVTWYNIYPFEASQGILAAVVYYRAGFLYCNLLCSFMYLGIIFFYPSRSLEFISKPVIKKHLWWALPFISMLLFYLVTSTNGLVETVGSAYHTECLTGMHGKDAIVTSFANTEAIEAKCYNEYAYNLILPETKPIGKLLMLVPLLSAIISSVVMLGAWRRFNTESGREEEAIEARSLFIGFIGKIVFKGTMIFCVIVMTIKF